MHTRGLAQPAALTNGASNGSASPSAAASPHQPPSLEHYVYSFLRFVKDPSPGRALGLRFGGLQVKVSRPGFRVLPTVDTECMRQLFACLSKENIIQLVRPNASSRLAGTPYNDVLRLPFPCRAR